MVVLEDALKEIHLRVEHIMVKAGGLAAEPSCTERSSNSGREQAFSDYETYKTESDRDLAAASTAVKDLQAKMKLRKIARPYGR